MSEEDELIHEMITLESTLRIVEKTDPLYVRILERLEMIKKELKNDKNSTCKNSGR